MKGDLHIHSYYSDGYCAPAYVMTKAKQAGCEIVSLTDHDTISGMEEARAKALSLGIKFVTGVEISACYKREEIHVLGYGFDAYSPRFLRFIEGQKQYRRERAARIFAMLARHGIAFAENAFAFDVPREISRSHIADAMVRAGQEPDFETAFAKWLRSTSPTYVPMDSVLPQTAIDEIHAAGGFAVLAHPMRIDLDSYERTALIEKLAAYGLDGLEAVYKHVASATVREYTHLAERLGLFVTAGADFHREPGEILARVQNNPIVDL